MPGKGNFRKIVVSFFSQYHSLGVACAFQQTPNPRNSNRLELIYLSAANLAWRMICAIYNFLENAREFSGSLIFHANKN